MTGRRQSSPPRSEWPPAESRFSEVGADAPMPVDHTVAPTFAHDLRMRRRVVVRSAPALHLV